MLPPRTRKSSRLRDFSLASIAPSQEVDGHHLLRVGRSCSAIFLLLQRKLAHTTPRQHRRPRFLLSAAEEKRGHTDRRQVIIVFRRPICLLCIKFRRRWNRLVSSSRRHLQRERVRCGCYHRARAEIVEASVRITAVGAPIAVYDCSVSVAASLSFCWICICCGSEKVKMTALKDIVPAAQNNIDTKFILLEKGRTIVEGQNKMCMALVADETAAVHLQLWGDECDAFVGSDIIYLTNGIFSYQWNNLVLRAGKRGKLQKIGEFTLSYVESPNMSEIHWTPDPNNSKKYIPEHVISPYSRIFPLIP